MRQYQNRYANIIGTAGGRTVALSNKPGRVERVIVNRVSAGDGFALRDSTGVTPAGTSIANVTLSAGDTVGSIEYGADFGSGLTITVTGATLDLTVVFHEYDREAD